MDPTAFILPLAGIGLIVLLVWLLRGGRSVDLDRANVMAALDAEGVTADRIVLSTDARSGLAWIGASERLAAVRSMGDDVGVAILTPDDIEQLSVTGRPPVLTLRFRSIGQSVFRMRFADEDELERWRDALALYGEVGEKSGP